MLTSRENVARYLVHTPIVLDRSLGDPVTGVGPRELIYESVDDDLPWHRVARLARPKVA
jgi:hypothetical protein